MNGSTEKGRNTRDWECFRWRESVPMWLKGLTLEGEIVRNPSVSLNLTLTRNEKVEHYIKIKIHKLIVLRFWVESDVNVLCGQVQVSLVLYILSDTPLYKLNNNKDEIEILYDNYTFDKSNENF